MGNEVAAFSGEVFLWRFVPFAVGEGFFVTQGMAWQRPPVPTGSTLVSDGQRVGTVTKIEAEKEGRWKIFYKPICKRLQMEGGPTGQVDAAAEGDHGDAV